MNFEPETIKAVSHLLMGEPNTQLSTATEIRYGTHGSMVINIAENTFFDHELNAGGGVLDLICREAEIETHAQAVGWLKKQGLLPDDRQADVTSRVVQTYDYRDESGTLLFQVQRREPKKFVQRKPDGDGWIYKVKGVRQVPYRLPELLASPPNKSVYVVEGEKDADRLAALGLVATCNAGGAGKWRKEFSEYLKDRTVIVIPDNDDAGRDHAQKVAQSLRKNSTQIVRILELPDLPEKGDVSDWLDAGGTVEVLVSLKTTTPEKPKTDAPSDEEDGEKKRSQTDLLVEFAKIHFELIHDKNGDVFARDNRSGEVRRLGGRQFKDKLIA